MKIVCSQDQLLAKLQIAARGVSQRSTVQILSGILLNASGERIELSSTDMEISLRVPLEARVEEPGDVVLPGRLLLDIVRALPAADVTIAQPGGTGAAQIECGPSRYSLNTQNAEDFPQLPVPSGSSFSVDRAAFVDTVSHVGRAASKDESRPVLTGVLVELGEGTVTMAATDSYRLSVKESALPGATGDVQAIVPARALGEVVRISTGDSLEVSVQENQVLFGMDGVWLSARRIDGQFPNYKQLLPQTFEHEIAISKEELLDVIRRTSLMAQRNLPGAAELRGGVADPGRPDPGRRRGTRVAAGRFSRRPARDRVQPGFPARWGGERGGRHGAAEADQLVAPGAVAGRGRLVLVSDHADPSALLARRGLCARWPCGAATSGVTSGSRSSCRPDWSASSAPTAPVRRR